MRGKQSVKKGVWHIFGEKDNIEKENKEKKDFQ